jgi:hypothetical protein
VLLEILQTHSLSFVYNLSDFKEIEDLAGQTEKFIGKYTTVHFNIFKKDATPFYRSIDLHAAL